MQTLMPRSFQVKAVQVHDLVPGGDKVMHELFRCIVLRIDLGQGAQLYAYASILLKMHLHEMPFAIYVFEKELSPAS